MANGTINEQIAETGQTTEQPSLAELQEQQAIAELRAEPEEPSLVRLEGAVPVPGP